MTHSDANKKTGKLMLVLAWVAGLFLLTLWFEEQLAEQWNPNDSGAIGSNASSEPLVLKRNRYGHYVTSGTINGRKVTFLLDTGATEVSIPAHLNAKLGLVLGTESRVMTANGAVTVFRTNIDELGIGHLKLNNVSGHLNPAMKGDEVLLGMSALKRLEFIQKGDQLTLKLI